MRVPNLNPALMDIEIHGPILHQWTFKEFEHHQHALSWRILIGTLIIAGVAGALWYRNFTFAFLLFGVGIVLIARELQGPETLRVRVQENAMMLLLDEHHQMGRPATTIIPWNQIKSFWMYYRPPEAKILYIDFQSPVRQRLKIPLEDQDPIEIRSTLSRFLSEDFNQDQEPFADAFARLFKIG